MSISLTCNAAVGLVTDQVNALPTIQRQNQTLSGSKGTGVEMNDAIKTSQGKLGITFDDNTKVQITENSKLVIDDFVYDAKTTKGGKLVMKVALGTVRYASGQVAKNSPQSVSITTPTATIGVRGTDFTATVDELGRSLIILLPSCPAGKKDTFNIDKDCITGEISVATEMGTVILNKPFQATRVDSRMTAPTKPITLNLSEDAISNLLIISPPKEAKDANKKDTKMAFNPLDVDFLKESSLENLLEMQNAQLYQSTLSRNYLDQEFLSNIFDIVGTALTEDFLKELDSVLPDYRKSSGIIALKDELIVSLCRDDGSNQQCITTPLTQNSTVLQTQGSFTFKNRVNAGGNTIITVTQK